MKISHKSWKTTVILFHVLGVFGAHRFYVGKAGTGLLYIAASFLAWVSSTSSGIFGRVLFGKTSDWMTYYLLGIIVLMDLIKIYSGNFTDENGALVLPPYKQMLLQAICRSGIAQEASSPGAPVLDAPANTTQPAPSGPVPAAAGSGVIRMTHVAPGDIEYMQKTNDYYAIGLNISNAKVDELVIYEVRAGEILRSCLYSPRTGTPQDFVDFLGPHAVLVGYGLRENFRAFAALLGDADADASWEYVDLQELPEKEGVKYTQAETALDLARNAIDYFEEYRAE